MDDGWLAYQLDLACLLLGGRVERLMRPPELGGEGLSLDEALGQAEEGEAGRSMEELRRRFRSGAARVTRKVTVPASGVW